MVLGPKRERTHLRYCSFSSIDYLFFRERDDNPSIAIGETPCQGGEFPLQEIEGITVPFFFDADVGGSFFSGGGRRRVGSEKATKHNLYTHPSKTH